MMVKLCTYQNSNTVTNSKHHALLFKRETSFVQTKKHSLVHLLEVKKRFFFLTHPFMLFGDNFLRTHNLKREC